MSEGADRVEMHFLSSLLFVHSLGPSSERRPVACTDKFCVIQIPVSLVGSLVFTILVFESGVQIMYTSCCCQNHLILIKNLINVLPDCVYWTSFFGEKSVLFLFFFDWAICFSDIELYELHIFFGD